MDRVGSKGKERKREEAVEKGGGGQSEFPSKQKGRRLLAFNWELRDDDDEATCCYSACSSAVACPTFFCLRIWQRSVKHEAQQQQ